MDRLAFLSFLAISPLGIRRDEPTAGMRYRQATDLILRGKRFERAAELLRLAQKQSPEDLRMPVALGCALVSRVASLVYAGVFAYSLQAEQRNYPKELEAWEKGKDDPESEHYREPRPTPPPVHWVLRTKDDEQPFNLKPRELAVRATALVAEARQAFESARKLAKTPEAQAEVAYVEGWSLLVLQGYSYDADAETGESTLFSEVAEEGGEGEDIKTKTLYPKPDTESIHKAFREATEKDPTQPAYWQSLGDVEGDPKKAEPFYRRSLEINPRNAGLWYRLYEREMRKQDANLVSPSGSPERDRGMGTAKALADLRMAARYDPSNAWYAYEEAATAFKNTRYSRYSASRNAANAPRPGDPENAALWKTQRDAYEELRQVAASAENRQAARHALQSVERGNRALNWRFPDYQEPIPRLLAAARGYSAWASKEFAFFARIRELARSLGGYALYLASEERDNSGAVRACRAAIALGQRLEGDWPEKEHYLGDFSILRTLVGHAVVAIALKVLVDVEKCSGSAERASYAQAELNEFSARVRAHKETMRKSAEDWRPYNFY